MIRGAADTYAELELAVRARVPLVALVTPEESRAEERLLRPIATEWREGRLFAWSTTEGYHSVDCGGEREPASFAAPDPLSALEVAAGYEHPALFVLRDFHHYVENAALLRRLRDLAAALPPDREARRLPRPPLSRTRGPPG